MKVIKILVGVWLVGITCLGLLYVFGVVTPEQLREDGLKIFFGLLLLGGGVAGLNLVAGNKGGGTEPPPTL